MSYRDKIMQINQISNILVLPSDTKILKTRSIRVATNLQVTQTYFNFYYFLNQLKQENETNEKAEITIGQFNDILGTCLLTLAHSEPAHYQTYPQVVLAPLGKISVNVKISELVSRMACSPVQFLCAHANTVYKLAINNAIIFDFGTFSGMTPNLPGVGFVGFPFVTINDDKRGFESEAFQTILKQNEFLREWWFSNKLY